MKTSTKRILSIFIAGVLFMGTLVVYGNLIQPELQRALAKRSEVHSKSTVFRNQREAAARVQELIAQLRGVQDVQQTVTLMVPLRPEVPQALAQMQAVARVSGAQIRSFAVKTNPFEASAEPLVKRLGVLETTLSASGTYEALKGFVRGVETNARLMNIREIKFTPETTVTGLGNSFVASIVAEAYYQE